MGHLVYYNECYCYVALCDPKGTNDSLTHMKIFSTACVSLRTGVYLQKQTLCIQKEGDSVESSTISLLFIVEVIEHGFYGTFCSFVDSGRKIRRMG